MKYLGNSDVKLSRKLIQLNADDELKVNHKRQSKLNIVVDKHVNKSCKFEHVGSFVARHDDDACLSCIF